MLFAGSEPNLFFIDWRANTKLAGKPPAKAIAVVEDAPRWEDIMTLLFAVCGPLAFPVGPMSDGTRYLIVEMPNCGNLLLCVSRARSVTKPVEGVLRYRSTAHL